jgi:hypothetical protein
MGNAYGYRIKDFGAYYIGRIIGKPMQHHRNPADRDRDIDKLKQELALL